MTIIRPNSISGITSITSTTTDQLKLFDSNGAWISDGLMSLGGEIIDEPKYLL